MTSIDIKKMDNFMLIDLYKQIANEIADRLEHYTKLFDVIVEEKNKLNGFVKIMKEEK